jgi:hypothetical protein
MIVFKKQVVAKKFKGKQQYSASRIKDPAFQHLVPSVLQPENLSFFDAM